MNRLCRSLRTIATQVARRDDFPTRVLIEERGLEEVLEEASDHDYGFEQIVSLALWRMCVTNGRFNNFQVGLKAVLQFVRENTGNALTPVQLRDLHAVLNQSGTQAAIDRWVQSNFQT